MSEVSEILAEIENFQKESAELAKALKSDFNVDSPETVDVLFGRIKALLESHMVIDEGTSYALVKAANNTGSNIARDVIGLELDRLTPTEVVSDD